MRDLVVGMMLLALLAGCGSRDERQVGQPGEATGKPPQPAQETLPKGGPKVGIVPPAPVSGDCLMVVVSGPMPSRNLSWFLDNELVQEGELGQYCVPEGSRGKTVAVLLGETQTGPGASASINNAPPEVLDTQLKLVVEGPRRYLESIPAAKDFDGDQVTFTYKWYVNGEPNAFASENRLEIDAIRKGDLIKLEILPNDGTVDGPLYATLESPVPGSPPQIVSQPPTSFRSNEFVYQVKAQDPDDDLLTYHLEKPPEGASIDAGTGLLTWPLTMAAPGEHKLTVVVSDPEGQKGTQEFAINVTRQEDGN